MKKRTARFAAGILLAALLVFAPAFLPAAGISGGSAGNTRGNVYAARIAGRGAGTGEPGKGPGSGAERGTGSGAENSGSFTIAFAGDILFDPVYTAGRKVTSRGVAGSCDEKTLERMRAEDVFVVNNEFTYTRGGKRSGKTYAFRTDPRYAAMLQEMGVDLVTLANNHTWDFGEQGFLDTLATLEETGIPYIGGGRNLAEAMRPKVFEAGGMKIAVLNATEIERTRVWTKAAGPASGPKRLMNSPRACSAALTRRFSWMP